MERAPFERELEILEPNRFIKYGPTVLMLLGPLAFLLAMARVFPPGILGLHFAVLGLIGFVFGQRENWRPHRVVRRVRADAQGVHVDGQLRLPRAKIKEGYYQPRPMPTKGGLTSSVRLTGKLGQIHFEAGAEEPVGVELLRALSLDAASKRAEFRGASPLHATFGRNLGFVAAILAATVCLSVLIRVLHVHAFAIVFPLVIVPPVLASMLPSTIAVGVDGILTSWLWQKKFIPMSQIVQVLPRGDRTIKVELADGRSEMLYTYMRRKNNLRSDAVVRHRDAVLARIREAMQAHRSQGKPADVSALVGKGTRDSAAWLEALDEMKRSMAGIGQGYRDALIRKEDLLRLVIDPSAPEDARAGAALLLRPSLDDDGRARLRVAADATASPRLRVVLDAAVDEEEDEAAVTEAMREFAD